MYISRLKMENFRCFSGITEVSFSKTMNFFVGDNNCGKTTIFKAIEFLTSAKSADGWLSKNTPGGEVTVEITLRGNDLLELLETDKFLKYIEYCDRSGEEPSLILRRSSRVSYWFDSKNKEKEIRIKNIALYHPGNGTYENPAGIDTVLSGLFEPQYVYSDLDNDEYQDFAKTKIVGKLINGITESFQKSEVWKEFEKAHDDAFGDQGLVSQLRSISTQIEEIMQDQFDDIKVEFDFGLPTIENFFKTGQILLEDNGIKTRSTEKGTGLQRALALSLIQVYAQNATASDSNNIIFFLDEPETFLHPRAQDKLLQSLKNLSSSSQIFITTHSPYLLKSFSKEDTIKIFKRGTEERIQDGSQMNLFTYSPTWSEINYFAFDVAGVEFHIELYGLLHKKVQDIKNVEYLSINAFDKWLADWPEMTPALPDHVNRSDRTMTTYIRNWIDHPGEKTDGKRPKPTREEIRTSIEAMLTILRRMQEDETV